MLAVLVSWTTTFVVLFSFGDFLVYISNCICKQKEEYSIIDTLFLGLCFILIPLSLSSFFIPSNHWVLIAYLIFSIIYCVFRRNHYLSLLKRLRRVFSNLSLFQIVLFVIAISGFIMLSLWSRPFEFDPNYYHYQNIRWNEEYAIVPGLGNIEDRFGFNSNYLLVSAIFTFRFLFNSSIYLLQSLFAVSIMIWILYEAIKSKYNIVTLFLLVLYCMFIFISKVEIGNTTTDMIPNLAVFYIAAHLILYPDSLHSKKLLYIVVPISLITFKLSVVPFTLLSIYCIFLLLKNKNTKIVLFTGCISSSIVFLWLIRNIVISGYILYPVYQVDIFSFDWKVPIEIALKQTEYIKFRGDENLSILTEWMLSAYHGRYMQCSLLINILIYFLVIISPFVVLYSHFRKKEDRIVYILYLVLLGELCYWLFTAPDIRFALGPLLIISFITLKILLRVP